MDALVPSGEEEPRRDPVKDHLYRVEAVLMCHVFEKLLMCHISTEWPQHPMCYALSGKQRSRQ
jgi:hypothetical protein